jgi:hypothetical protein
VVADEALSPLFAPDKLALHRSRDGQAFLARSGVPIAALEGNKLRAVKETPETHPYLFYDDPRDWRVYIEPRSGSPELTLERPVRTDNGDGFDTIRGGDLFEGGQFAFDRVPAVTRTRRTTRRCSSRHPGVSKRSSSRRPLTVFRARPRCGRVIGFESHPGPHFRRGGPGTAIGVG